MTDSKVLGVKYLSQLDNDIDPRQTCNTTCLAMVAAYFGIVGDGNGQLEDQFSASMRKLGYNRYYMTEMCAFLNATCHTESNNLHATFTQTCSITKLQANVNTNMPTIISGAFTPSWHFIVVDGYRIVDGKLEFHVLDPAGEWYSDGYVHDVQQGHEWYSGALIQRMCCDPAQKTPFGRFVLAAYARAFLLTVV